MTVLHHKNITFFKIKLFISICMISYLFSSNQHPIILMHGFMGWGRDEMSNYYYWGGFTDLEEYLKSEGFEVYSVSMGPISSNWDRAIEAFHQIKGGQVNYGKAHSIEYGLIQKPMNKTYDGLYKNWDNWSYIFFQVAC